MKLLMIDGHGRGLLPSLITYVEDVWIPTKTMRVVWRYYTPNTDLRAFTIVGGWKH
jgi:hypothetical protein